MRTVGSIVIVGLALLVLTPAAVSGQDASPPVQGLAVGDAAPAFELPGSDGKTYQLGDLDGERAVVLAWFPKAFTGG